MTPIAEVFSLFFGCLASANIFDSNREYDFSLDFGPRGTAVHMHTSVHEVAEDLAHWGGTDQIFLILVSWQASQA